MTTSSTFKPGDRVRLKKEYKAVVHMSQFHGMLKLFYVDEEGDTPSKDIWVVQTMDGKNTTHLYAFRLEKAVRERTKLEPSYE